MHEFVHNLPEVSLNVQDVLAFNAGDVTVQLNKIVMNVFRDELAHH